MLGLRIFLLMCLDSLSPSVLRRVLFNSLAENGSLNEGPNKYAYILILHFPFLIYNGAVLL